MNAITETKASHSGVYAALAMAQTQMGKALKAAANPHFKTKYADLADVTEAALPALNANGIAVFQPLRTIDGQHYVVTIFAHSSGETIECAVPLLVNKNDMQGLGSAITYARRYGLMMMAGIAPEDDDGNAAVSAAPMIERRPAPRPPAVSEDAIAEAFGYLTGADDLPDLQRVWGNIPADVKAVAKVIAAKDARKAQLQKPADMAGDLIPY